MKLLELENFWQLIFFVSKKVSCGNIYPNKNEKEFLFRFKLCWDKGKGWNVLLGQKHFPGLDSAIKIFIQPLENGIVVCKSKIVPRRLRHFQGQTSAASPFTATSRRLFN